jgi:polyisoprenoid-binding protein YceI
MILRILLLSIVMIPTLSTGQEKGDKTIDVQRSSITIRVGKSGAFSAAGHNHTVTAPITSGTFNDSDKPRVEFQVAAAKMKVEPDPKDEKHQAEVQQTMQEKVLESAKYPEIKFRSTNVEKAGDGAWTVKGSLTLHGVTQPVAVSVKKAGEIYSGTAVIKQTDFGIKPISVGGMVKVKNELDITFDIR